MTAIRGALISDVDMIGPGMEQRQSCGSSGQATASLRHLCNRDARARHDVLIAHLRRYQIPTHHPPIGLFELFAAVRFRVYKAKSGQVEVLRPDRVSELLRECGNKIVKILSF